MMADNPQQKVPRPDQETTATPDFNITPQRKGATLPSKDVFTHVAYFKKPSLKPTQLTQDQADRLISARISIQYKDSVVVTVGSVQCQLKDISYIEKLEQPRVQQGSYHCRNEKCHKENRLHHEGEKCDYDLTGECIECGKQIWERDREYSMSKWGKVVCRTHSPFGKADIIFPGDRNPELSLMRGLAAAFVQKGMSDEQVVEVVEKQIKRLGRIL